MIVFNKYSRAKKRVEEAGVVNFYYDRNVLSKDVGPIGDFVSKAKSDVTYVGCWLSSSLTSQNLAAAIKKSVQKGIRFTFCLISPKSNMLENFASFFSTDALSIKIQIENSFLSLYKIIEELPKKDKDKVEIYCHNEMIITSFWVIDKDFEDSKLQLDFKLVKTPRWFSFGMEVDKKGKLYESIMQSYLSVIEEKNRITEYDIEELRGERAKKEKLKEQILDVSHFDANKPYIFVSYCHKDWQRVWSDVLKLKAKYNCWIDFEQIDGGRNGNENDWTMKIKPVLENPMCKGVITYASERGFLSSGYVRECDWLKVKRPDFYCFLIDFEKNIVPSKMLTLIKNLQSDGETEREKQIREEALIYVTQATVFAKESYYHYDDEGRHLLSSDFTNWVKKILVET